MGSVLLRKLLTTFIVTITISIAFALSGVLGQSDLIYNRGNQFVGWLSIYMMYVGVIILIYGNLVSLGLEYLLKNMKWLYIPLHGLFGLVNGILFQVWGFAIYGMLAALLYALIDRWLYKRSLSKKYVIPVLAVPVVITLLLWGYLQLVSPQMPPFTKEDAVEFATSGEGTVIDSFPKQIGIWEGQVEGLTVKRETNAKEIGDEIYLITFTETWGNEGVEHTWSLSYEVERGSMTARGEEGVMPSYYK